MIIASTCKVHKHTYERDHHRYTATHTRANIRIFIFIQVIMYVNSPCSQSFFQGVHLNTYIYIYIYIYQAKLEQELLISLLI
jgi:hypothetical protein